MERGREPTLDLPAGHAVTPAPAGARPRPRAAGQCAAHRATIARAGGSVSTRALFLSAMRAGPDQRDCAAGAAVPRLRLCLVVLQHDGRACAQTGRDAGRPSGPGPTSLVIEVASNDGYLLQFYKQRGIPVLGIEPAANIAELAIATNGIPTMVEFFDEELARRLAAEGKHADVIHAHNVFAHIPDPNRFVGGVKQVLRRDGVAVVEAPYVRDLIAKLEFDTIYHEHFNYYSVSAVEALCRRHGLMICDVELVPIHGGSLRLFMAHAGAPPSARVGQLLAREKSDGLLSFDYYRDFSDRVARLKEQLLALLRRLHGEGRRVAAYGASAKGSTLMNAFGIDRRLIEFVVDRSHLKQGRFTPGNHLPILPPEALLERRPDYVLLLTWNFATEILAQQGEFRRMGGKFIVPVPEVTIV